MTDRDTLLGYMGGWVTVTHPTDKAVWQGRLIGLADDPSLLLDGYGGARMCLPQSYDVKSAEPPAPPNVPPHRPPGEPRPLAELRDSGLLWLLNRVALHPRGLALAMHYDDAGECTGWSLLSTGDGSPWTFDVITDADGKARAEATLTAVDRQEATP
ncbi:hypothetical protein VSR01_17415 [Actinacidiphila sp. DG2A-62]|uniref:hypothetical protein n=1 Tax=Actinacidiphila sp. DG2A-62 TaxID=3108821 RepID=UPI002DBF40C8|nr:hypothetical protein [Actinacidiphila sp. DG2A-62]MEC3995218.1 hypothetical protein [Actinacidiphila sp. DG2A-62]